MIGESVLGKLLLYAYRAEFDEGEVIFGLLPEIPSEDDWNVLMTMFKDNVVHMEMLEGAIEKLGLEVPEVRPRNIPTISDRNRILEFIAKFEQTAFNFYRYLYENTDFTRVNHGSEIKNTLRALMDWERKHIEMIKKTLENFKVRYKLL